MSNPFEKVDKTQNNTEKKFSLDQITNLLPNEIKDSVLVIQKGILNKMMIDNPDIKLTDSVDFESNITLVNHSDLETVNPKEESITIKINGVTVADFINEYMSQLENQISQINLEKDRSYSIYNFNQSFHIIDTSSNNSKNQSGFSNFVSKGKIV